MAQESTITIRSIVAALNFRYSKRVAIDMTEPDYADVIGVVQCIESGSASIYVVKGQLSGTTITCPVDDLIFLFNLPKGKKAKYAFGAIPTDVLMQLVRGYDYLAKKIASVSTQK